jgi:hypothetical protein
MRSLHPKKLPSTLSHLRAHPSPGQKKRSRVLLFVLAATLSGLFLEACSGSTDGDSNAAVGGTSGTGGRTSSGGAGAIDPDALAKNCAGLTVDDGTSCTKEDLVCKDEGGSLCLCQRGRSGVFVWDCLTIGSPPGSGGREGGGGDGPMGGDAGAPSSGGRVITPEGGDSNAGSRN